MGQALFQMLGLHGKQGRADTRLVGTNGKEIKFQTVINTMLKVKERTQ